MARARGANDPGERGRRSVCSPCGSAILLGLPLAAALALFARPVVQLLGGEGAALDAAVIYLRISAIGVPFVLLALVGAGVFRGVADLRTPLAIVFTASVVNLLLEIVAVYGLDLGIAGSAWSTVVVQIAAAAAYLLLMRRHLAAAPSRRPDRAELASLVRSGSHLVLRVVSLIAAFAIATAVAARIDTTTVAAHQVVNTMFTLLALSLDAFAIPAQTLVAEALGAGDAGLARRVGERVLVLSVVVGGALTIVLAALSPFVARVFSSDPAVTSRVTAGLVVLAVLLLPGSVAFALDGVLIGAGDVRFLGRAMVIALAIYVPFVALPLAAPLARDRRGVGGAGDLDDGPGGADAPALPGDRLDQLITSPGRSTPGGGAAPCRWWCRRRGRGGRSCRAAG